MIWSIDPGERIGIAIWTSEGDLVTNEVWSVDTLIGRLGDVMDDILTGPSTIVMEDWRLRGSRAMQQTGSRMVACQVIGMVRLFAHAIGAELILQQPQVMKISAMHANIPYPKGHVPDKLAAFLHGRYYFEGIDVLKPVSLSDRLASDDPPAAR